MRLSRDAYDDSVGSMCSHGVLFSYIAQCAWQQISIGWRRTLQQSSRKEQGMTRLSRFRPGVHVLGVTKGKLALNFQHELVVGFQLMVARVNNLKQFLLV